MVFRKLRSSHGSRLGPAAGLWPDLFVSSSYCSHGINRNVQLSLCYLNTIWWSWDIMHFSTIMQQETELRLLPVWSFVSFCCVFVGFLPCQSVDWGIVPAPRCERVCIWVYTLLWNGQLPHSWCVSFSFASNILWIHWNADQHQIVFVQASYYLLWSKSIFPIFFLPILLCWCVGVWQTEADRCRLTGRHRDRWTDGGRDSGMDRLTHKGRDTQTDI